MNVFDNGQGDARQLAAPTLKSEHSLFRKRYRQLEPQEVALHDAIKDKADEMVNLFTKIVSGQDTAIMNGDADSVKRINARQQDLGRAVAHLEDAVYRVVKALTG